MVSERDRILELVKYFNSLGIKVNIGKNRAQGNKGFFKVINGDFRIDVSKDLSDDAVLRTLVHEFSHYIHYINDKTLKSLEFILGENWEEYLDELIELTVDSIPKQTISPLFDAKNTLKSEINELEALLINQNPNFIKGKSNSDIEKKIIKAGYKHLLKYDRVKVSGFLGYKILTIDSVDNLSEDLVLYLKLKSKERMLKRVNSRMSKMNKYYNSPTELLARAFEMYMFNRETVYKKAPNVFLAIENTITSQKILELNNLIQILILN